LIPTVHFQSGWTSVCLEVETQIHLVEVVAAKLGWGMVLQKANLSDLVEKESQY